MIQRLLLRWHDRPLNTKLAVLLVLLAVVPLAAVALYNDTSTRSELLAGMRSQNLLRATGTAEALDLFLKGMLNDISYIATDPDKVEFLRDPMDERLRARARVALERFRKTHGFDALYLTDPGGDVLLASEDRFLGRSYAATPYFANALAGQTSIDEPRYDPHDGQIYLHFSAPIRSSSDGATLGTAIGRTTMAALDRIVVAESDPTGRGGFGILWDEAGIRLIPGRLPELRFRPLAPLPPEMAAAVLAEERFGPTTGDLLGNASEIQELVDRSRLLLRDRSADPHLRFESRTLGLLDVAIAPLKGKRWLYGIATPEAGMLPALDAQTQPALLITAAIALLVAITALGSARRLSRPLRLVAEAANALAAGDMARRTGLRQRDEVGQLAAAFDAMADTLARKEAQLQDYAQELELMVGERTAEVRRLGRLYRVLGDVNQAVVRIRERGKLLEEVCRVAVEHGGLRMVWVGLVDGSSHLVEPVARWGFDEGYLETIQLSVDDVPEGRGPAGMAIRTGEPFVCNDIAQAGCVLPWREEALKRGYRSVTALPLRVNSAVIGALIAYTGEKDFFGDDEIQLLDELAADISFALESIEREEQHKRAEQALRRSEERYRQLVEVSPDGIVVHCQGEIVFANTAAARLLGAGCPQQLVGKPMLDFAAPDFRRIAEERIRLMGEEGRQVPMIEGRFIRLDGTTADVEVAAVPSTYGDKQAIQVVFRDITERKRTAELIRRRLEFEETVSRISSRFVAVSGLDDSINASLADAGGLTGADRVYLFLLRDGKETMDNTHEWCAEGVSPEKENLQNLPVEMFPWWMSKLREGEAIHINDVSRMPSEAEAERRILEAQGIKSLLILPVQAGSELAGFVGLDDVRRTGEWKESDLALLRLFSDILGSALQRERAEEALRQSEGLYRTLVEAIDDGITVKDAEGRYVTVNAEMARRFGRPREEILGKRPLDLYKPETGHRVMEGNLRAIATGTVVDTEEQYPERERGRICHVRRAPIRNEAGEVVGVVTVSRDITERKRLEAQLLRAQRLETAGKIAAQVAHDFNNLLVPMVSYPELIKRRLPAEHPAIPLCESMLEVARQMAEINEEMMALGRRGHLEQQPADLNQVVRQSIETIGDGPDGLTLDLSLAPNLLPVSGSPAQLARVVSNLVSNAREAMQDAGILHLKTENVYVDLPFGRYNRIEVGEYVRLTVADTGCGIPREIKDKIFDVFFTTKLKSKQPGSGLGLSIVQAIVEDHRGYLDLETEEGKGTTFSMYLPVLRGLVEKSQTEGVVGGTETILVVDDDRLQREAATQLLQTLGYRAEAVASGEEAVARLKGHSADLLILDMAMPGEIDGAETYRRIAAARPGQRAIILSGFAESEQVNRARALGVRAYLRKPVTLEKLARAVRQELDRDR